MKTSVSRWKSQICSSRRVFSLPESFRSKQNFSEIRLQVPGNNFVALFVVPEFARLDVEIETWFDIVNGFKFWSILQEEKKSDIS